jgi:hypothetical protein
MMVMGLEIGRDILRVGRLEGWRVRRLEGWREKPSFWPTF